MYSSKSKVLQYFDSMKAQFGNIRCFWWQTTLDCEMLSLPDTLSVLHKAQFGSSSYFFWGFEGDKQHGIVKCLACCILHSFELGLRIYECLTFLIVKVFVTWVKFLKPSFYCGPLCHHFFLHNKCFWSFPLHYDSVQTIKL